MFFGGFLGLFGAFWCFFWSLSLFTKSSCVWSFDFWSLSRYTLLELEFDLSHTWRYTRTHHESCRGLFYHIFVLCRNFKLFLYWI
jgi:hypothetical protein